MASEIRVNSITNRSGLGTVTFSDTGVVLSGVSTFSTGIAVAAGSASAPSITPTGDSNTGIFFPAADTIAFAEGGVEAVRIDSNSNIGIGTNNPTLGKLDVSIGGAGPTRIAFSQIADNPYIDYYRSTGVGANFYGFRTKLVLGDYVFENSPSNTLGSHTFTERVRINSSGNLGIGTDNPTQKLEVVGGEIKAGRVDTSQEGGQFSLARSTDNATAWYLDVYGNTSTPQLRFVDVSNASVRANIDSSGNFTLNSGNLVIGTAGKGIDFSATANSSGTMTSELLADYEEGTWDCRPTTSTSSIVLPSGISSLTFSGTYVKIGSMVYLTAYFETSQTSADTSVVYLRLPFAVNGTSNMWSATGTETNLWSFPSGVTYITVRPESGQSYASFKGCGTGIVRVDMTANRIFASGGMYWIGMMMYRTA